MVSIITCTIRDNCMKNVFQNYSHQNSKENELIIILNNDSMNEGMWRKEAKQYTNVTVYRLPERKTLGECLNFGIKKAKHPYIAKFDDDDYYGPNYLSDAMEAFKTKNTDVVGKAAYYAYIRSKKALILLHENAENSFTKWVAGATWVTKKEVFDKVQFKTINKAEDLNFYSQCKQQGFRIYANNKDDFCAIRRENVTSHSWRIKDEDMLQKGKLITHCEDFKPYVNN